MAIDSPALTVAARSFPEVLVVSAASPPSPRGSSGNAPFRDSLGKGIAPQLGGAFGLSVSIQIWNRVVCSSSRLYSACWTPVPALITWTSPAPVRPLLSLESWYVLEPLRALL